MAVRRDAETGKWIADARDATGRRRRRWFTRKQDAVQAEALEKARNPRSRNRPSPAVLTFGAYATDFLQQRSHGPDAIAGSTATLYALAIERVSRYLGTVPLRSITRADWRAALARLSESGLSPSTIRTNRNITRIVLRSALAEGLLIEDPSLEPIRRTAQKPQQRVRALTVSQAQAFLAAAADESEHHFAALALLLLAGLRSGEALALQPHLIEFEAGRLRVEAAVTREDGLKHAKTAAGHRAIPLAPQLADALRRLPLAGRFVLWPSEPRQGATLIGRLQARLFALVSRVGRAAGLEASPHDLRHTFASQLVASGTPVYAVSRWLGHRDIATTLRIYGSWLPPEQSADVHTFAARLLPTTAVPTGNQSGNGTEAQTSIDDRSIT